MRLEARLTIWLAVLLGASALLTVLAMQRFESQNVERQSRETASAMAQTIENGLEVSMLNDARQDIRRAVRAIQEGGSIRSVTVYGRDATPWVSSAIEPLVPVGDRRGALLAAMGQDRPVSVSGGGTLSVFAPIPRQPECIGCHAQQSSVLGAVEVRMEEAPFRERFTQNAKASLFLAAIPLLFGILLSVWAVRRSILRPLAQVGGAAARLADGDLSARLPAFEGWEFAKLSATFNEMAERLETQATGLRESLAQKEANLQALLRKTLTAQEEERRRIARELHDETSQVLSTLMMNIDLLESQFDAHPDLKGWSRPRIEAVKALAEEAARNLDKMMLDLRPALLDELGLTPALRWYAAQMSDLWGVPIRFGGERLEHLPEPVTVAAFRIVQEAVSNVVRHAKASSALVQLRVVDGSLRIEVSDDGVGFDVAEASSRARTGEAVGLLGMRERAELVGGSFTLTSEPGRGTMVQVALPLPTPMPRPEGADVA